MAEETYQEVVDKIKEDEVTKDEIPEEPNPKGDGLERIKTMVEEKEENESDFELEVQSSEKVAMKKKQPPCRAKLRDKVACPKCNKNISRHSYEYTHSKFCEGKPCKPAPPSPEGYDEEDEDVKETTKKMEQMTITEFIEETKPKPKPNVKPIAKLEQVEDKPLEHIPNDDDIKRYRSNIRKEKAMRKQQGYDKLIRLPFNYQKTNKYFDINIKWCMLRINEPYYSAKSERKAKHKSFLFSLEDMC